MIPGGDLSERITIQRDSSTGGPNQHGEVVPSWGALTMPWARVRHLSGRDAFTAGQDIAQRTVEFGLHWSATVAGVTSEDRILWSSDTYDIESVEVRRNQGEVILIGKQSGGA